MGELTAAGARRVAIWIALFALVAAVAASSALAAGRLTVTSAPKRVTAGAAVKVVAAVSDVSRCRLKAGSASASVSVRGADRVTFRFTVSRTARPARYKLTLRCGTLTRRLTITVRARAGRPGKSRKLVKGRIRFAVRPARTPQPGASPGPAAPAPTPAPPAPAPTPAPTPVVPGPANSFRAVYAVAADQVADPDHPAKIVATINAVNGWFATQTIGGVMPRWIRNASGAPVVTVITTTRPAADYAEDGFFKVLDDLDDLAPRAAPTQKSVVWMDVDSGAGCGQTGSGAGLSWIAQATCGIYPVIPAVWPDNDTYLVAHEMTHNFGAVEDCAPHATGNGHVNDDPRDILYSGPLPRDWDNQMLDPGRDDYYANGGCGDISKSAFWTLTSNPRS